MRRLVSILVLFVLVLNTIGFYAFYYVQLQQIRFGMRQALKTLPREQLDVLKMSPGEFAHAIEDGTEIEYEGRMYDIASFDDHGDEIIVYCKHDEREDSLMAMLDYVTNVPLNADSQIPSAVWQYLMLVFVIPVTSVALLIFFARIVRFSKLHLSVTSRVPQILTPPPKAAFVFVFR